MTNHGTVVFTAHHALRHVAEFVGLGVLVYLVLIVISIFATTKVLEKAGYSGWWVIVSFIPLVNLLMYLVFAFAEWPVVKQAKAAGAWPPGTTTTTPAYPAVARQQNVGGTAAPYAPPAAPPAYLPPPAPPLPPNAPPTAPPAPPPDGGYQLP